MTAANRLTSKGQVTIPVSIRRKLGIQAGDALDFAEDGDRVVLRKARPSSAEIDALIEAVTGSADRLQHMSTDEIMDEVRPHRLDPD